MQLPDACLSVPSGHCTPLLQVCCCGPSQAEDINRLLHSRQQQPHCSRRMRAVSHCKLTQEAEELFPVVQKKFGLVVSTAYLPRMSFISCILTLVCQDDQPEISFLIPQGTLPQQSILFCFIHRTTQSVYFCDFIHRTDFAGRRRLVAQPGELTSDFTQAQWRRAD